MISRATSCAAGAKIWTTGPLAQVRTTRKHSFCPYPLLSLPTWLLRNFAKWKKAVVVSILQVIHRTLYSAVVVRVIHLLFSRQRRSYSRRQNNRKSEMAYRIAQIKITSRDDMHSVRKTDTFTYWIKTSHILIIICLWNIPTHVLTLVCLCVCVSLCVSHAVEPWSISFGKQRRGMDPMTMY